MGKEHLEAALGGRHSKSYRVAVKSLRDPPQTTSKLNSTPITDLADDVLGSILQRRQALRIGPMAGLVPLGRDLAFESLVGAVKIVGVSPSVEPRLILL